MLIRPLVQPALKKALGQKISPDGMLLATGGLKQGQVQVPEGATLFAPLLINTMDYASRAPFTFTRASEGLYQRDGIWCVANENAPRFENGLLAEPAVTNKCRNWNANPDELLTGLTLSGDPAATVSRVDDAVELGLFGLSAVCSSGFAVLLDNSAGTSNADLFIEGECGNVNDHTLSVVARGSGNIVIRLVGPTSTEQTLDAHYQFYSVLETPVASNRDMMIRALPGTVCYFVLNQLEELPVRSSPIITRGATASRAQDFLTYQGGGSPAVWRSNNPGLDNFCEGWNAPICAGAANLQSSRRIENFTGTTCNFLRRDDQILSADKWYRVRFTLTEFEATSGNVAVLLGNQVVVGSDASAAGEYEVFFYQDGVPSDNRLQMNLSTSTDLTVEVSHFEVVELTDLFNQTEGIVVLDWLPAYSQAEADIGQQGLTLVNAGAAGLHYHDAVGLKSYDGVNNSYVSLPAFAAGDLFRTVSRWQPGDLDGGYWHQGSWVWDPSPQTYAGAFPADGYVYLLPNVKRPTHVKNLMLFNVNPDPSGDRSWIEGNLTP